MEGLFEYSAAIAGILEIKVFRNVSFVGGIGNELVFQHSRKCYIVRVFDRINISLVSTHDTDIAVAAVRE